MARQNINNGETGSSVRTKLNANFTELYDDSSIVVNGTYVSLQDPMIQVEAAAGPSISLYSTTAGSRYQWITGYVGSMLELYTNSVAGGNYDTLLMKVNQDLDWTIYGDIHMPQTLRTEALTVDVNMSARIGTFTNIGDGNPSLDVRSTNLGWGGSINFKESNGTHYGSLIASNNRFYLGSSGPMLLSNLAFTLGVSLDFSTNGLLKVMNIDANALADLQSSTATAGTSTYSTKISGDSDLGPWIEFKISTQRCGFNVYNTDVITPMKNGVMSANTLQLGNSSYPLARVVATTVQAGPLTVATLPAAASNEGHRTYVTDANAAMSGNFGAVVAGGGANKVPVFCDGTNWRIG